MPGTAAAPGEREIAILEPQIRARAEAFGGDREAGVADFPKDARPLGHTPATAGTGILVARLCQPMTRDVAGTVIPEDGGWTAPWARAAALGGRTGAASVR